jgi:hypothetical protein
VLTHIYVEIGQKIFPELNKAPTLMGLETSPTCLSDHIIPIYSDIDPNLYHQDAQVESTTKHSPLASGAKLGLENAFKS